MATNLFRSLCIFNFIVRLLCLLSSPGRGEGSDCKYAGGCGMPYCTMAPLTSDDINRAGSPLPSPPRRTAAVVSDKTLLLSSDSAVEHQQNRFSHNRTYLGIFTELLYYFSFNFWLFSGLPCRAKMWLAVRPAERGLARIPAHGGGGARELRAVSTSRSAPQPIKSGDGREMLAWPTRKLREKFCWQLIQLSNIPNYRKRTKLQTS